MSSNLAKKLDFFSEESEPKVQKVVRGKPLVYVLEDDPDLQSILSFNLQKESYEVTCFSTAEELLAGLERDTLVQPNLLIVDVNLQGSINGLEAVSHLRQKRKYSKIPVLMLTARGHAQDIVEGLNSGADDYLPKPFDLDVFLARVKSCLRRTEFGVVPIRSVTEKIESSGITLDAKTHEVWVEGKSISLTASEYKILLTLMMKPNEAFSREDLVFRVMGPTSSVTARTIDVHVRALRAKLGKKGRHVATVRSFGYKFSP